MLTGHMVTSIVFLNSHFTVLPRTLLSRALNFLETSVIFYLALTALALVVIIASLPDMGRLVVSRTDLEAAGVASQNVLLRNAVVEVTRGALWIETRPIVRHGAEDAASRQLVEPVIVSQYLDCKCGGHEAYLV